MASNLRDKLRNKWLSDRGYLHKPVSEIPNTPAAKEENRQSSVPNKPRKPYGLGVKPKRARKTFNG